MNNGAKTQIAHHCPFCGGPVAVDSEEIIAPCGNCSAMLRLIPPYGLESFVITGALPRREALFFLERELKGTNSPLIRQRGEIYQAYLPFYRAAGKVFQYNKASEKRTRVTDDGQEYSFNVERQDSIVRNREMSFAAFEDNRFGIESLGVRTLTLNLAPLTPARAAGKMFIRPLQDVNYALERYDKTTGSFGNLAAENALKRFTRAMCPHISLIYLPVWVINFADDDGFKYGIIDCVSRRVVKIAEGELGSSMLDCSQAQTGTIFRIVAHRCNHCGFDLPRQKRGEIFVCGNCGRLYNSHDDSYEQGKICLPRGELFRGSMFPFWMFRLSSDGDAARLKKMLSVNSDTIFIPAFEISNLKSAARLSLSLSRAIDELDFDIVDESDYNFMAATLTSKEASTVIIPLLLAGRDNLETYDLDTIWRLVPEYGEVRMVWLPFEKEGYFYRGLLTGQGFARAALTL